VFQRKRPKRLLLKKLPKQLQTLMIRRRRKEIRKRRTRKRRKRRKRRSPRNQRKKSRSPKIEINIPINKFLMDDYLMYFRKYVDIHLVIYFN